MPLSWLPRSRFPRSRAARRAGTLLIAAAIALPLTVAARAQTSRTKPTRPPRPAAAPAPAPAPASPQTSQARTLDLPFETLAYVKSDLPGYQLTLQQCSVCHSPEYVAYQPRTSTRAYWQATVDKMVKTFGAPLPPDQVAPIVDYLTRTYGSETPPAAK